MIYQTIFLQLIHKADQAIPSNTVYTDHGLFVVQTSPNSFSFFCFISSTVLQSTFSPVLLLLALSFFSTHVQYSPVARHLEYQEFSGVCCFYSPYLGSIEQTRTDATRAHHVGRLSFWLLKCCNSMDVFHTHSLSVLTIDLSIPSIYCNLFTVCRWLLCDVVTFCGQN